MYKQLTSLLGGIAVLATTHAASAYNLFGHEWSAGTVQMRASAVSFPSGSSWRSALGTVASRMYANPSNFWINQTYDDTSVGYGNGQSEIWWSSASGSSSVYRRWSTWSGNLIEADVVMRYGSTSWTSSTNKLNLTAYGGSRHSFHSKVLAAYCLVAGLDSEPSTYGIMCDADEHFALSGSTTYAYVGEDAGDGLVEMYGLWIVEDVGVVHWKWRTSGDHTLCQMYNSTGSVLPSSSYDGQRRYTVSAGQVVQVEFTFENNGASRQTPHVGYYVSTNNIISTYDDYIGGRRPGLNRNVVYTSKKTLTIPATLTTGTYYLGAFIDDDASISEWTSSNNTAYLIFRVY